MDELFPLGARWQEVAAAIARGQGEVRLRGLTPAAGAYMLSRLFFASRRPFLVLTPDEATQETLQRDLAFFFSDLPLAPGELWPRLLSFPAHELLPFQELSGDAGV